VTNKLLTILSLSVLVVLTGCAPMSMPEQLTNSDYQGSTTILVGTYAHTTGVEKYDIESIWIENIDTEETYRIHTRNTFDLFEAKTDYSKLDKNTEGFVFAFKLPPGKYRITSAVFTEGNMQLRGYDVFDTEFSIVAGKPNYLGELHTHVLEGKNFLGFTVVGGAIFMLTDKFERDLPFLRKEYPEVNWRAATIITPEPNTKDKSTYVMGKF
jgi:hypothetical protein